MSPIVSPEVAGLLGFVDYDEATSMPPHERLPMIRDVLYHVGLAPFSGFKLSFHVEAASFAFTQLSYLFRGNVVILSAESSTGRTEREGFYRAKPGEEDLFHADSEDMEAAADNLEETLSSFTVALIRQGVNYGQAFAMLPASAPAKAVATGSVPEFFEAYNAVAKRPGVYHPELRELLTDIWAELRRLYPSLTLALQERQK